MKANVAPIASLSPLEAETLVMTPAPVEIALAELPTVQASEPQALTAAPATIASVQVPAKPLTPGLAAPTGAWTMLGSLLLVLGLILLLARGVRALQAVRGGGNEALKLRGSLQVGSRERVVWMQAGETHLLLGVAAGRVNNLHVFEVPPDFDQPQLKGANGADFAARLRQVLDRARQRSATAQAPTPPPAAAAAAASAPVPAPAPASLPAVPAAAARRSRFHTAA
jgi:flagellar protein FliO/FliZ